MVMQLYHSMWGILFYIEDGAVSVQFLQEICLELRVTATPNIDCQMMHWSAKAHKVRKYTQQIILQIRNV